MMDEVLRAMGTLFESMYADCGRPSIPPERLLKAKVIQALYSVRRDRQPIVRIHTHILFRWFLDMNRGEAVFDAIVFTQNKDRLLEHHVARVFFKKIYERKRSHLIHWWGYSATSMGGVLKYL